MAHCEGITQRIPPQDPTENPTQIGNGKPFPGGKSGPELKLTTFLYVVLHLRTSVAIPPLHRLPLWRAQGKLLTVTSAPQTVHCRMIR